jgi:hypothetical protein
VSGTLICGSDFKLFTVEVLGHMFVLNNSEMTGKRAAEINQGGATWDADHPVIIGLGSNSGLDPSSCRFTPHE